MNPEKSRFNALARLQRFKQAAPAHTDTLGPAMVSFFKHSVAKRMTKLGQIAGAWGQLVPEALTDHCALEGYNKGTLTVIVDSASHLYELKQLLLAGLQDQLFIACKTSGLKKIALKRGQWYEELGPTERKLRFT